MDNKFPAPSIYVHIPFCGTKCPYCSFPVVVGQMSREDDYLDALAREAAARAGMRALTLYVGGGTPSMLSDDGIIRLSRLLEANFTIDGQERTFELNPEGVTLARARLLRSLGFTRASFGMQSFAQKHLDYLGRHHRAAEGFRVFKVLREAGFDNINVDLMFGFPGQTRPELDQDIDAVLSLGSEHVSLYALTVEPRSVFHVRGEKLADDLQAGYYRRICARLESAGVRQYEVSNFARPGFESRHNLNYWQGGEYAGIGMGAHSHLGGERSWNADTFPQYMQMMASGAGAVVGRERLGPEAKMMEALLFGLRMNDGVDVAAIEGRHGCALSSDRREEIAALAREGFLEARENSLRATEKGRLVLDEIAARLI